MSDTKRVERENRLARQRRKTRLRVAAVVLILLLLVAAIVTLYRSPVFTIERIEVVENARLTDEQVTTLAALPSGATLLRYPRAEIEERLLASPWIADVQVSRDFPDGLRIRVIERQPVLLVDVGESLFWLIDREGVVLEQRAPDTGDTMIVVRDLTDFEPVEGVASASAALGNCLAIVEGLSDELRRRVRAISAESIDLTTLLTTDDIEILVGSAEDIERKDIVARSVLEEQEGSAVYINVRTPDRPTWRGLDLP